MASIRLTGGRACACAMVVVLSATGCTSAKQAAPSSGSLTPVAAATRWWSNAAVTVGSTIDPASPGAEASKLVASRSDYCGMLRQTLASGTVLAGLQSADPKLLTSAKAFVAEIEQVAPSNVSGSWQVLGPVILGVVKSGATSAAGVDTAKNLQAAEAIATDAQASCNVDLSKVITTSLK